MGLAALSDGVVESGEVLHDAFGARCDEGVVGIGSANHGRETGVDVVPGGGAHRSGLKTTGEAHALGGKLVDVGGVGLAAVAAEIAVGAIVRDDENDIRFGGGRQSEKGEGEEGAEGSHKLLKVRTDW